MLLIIVLYFAVLLTISHINTKSQSNQDFFIGGKKSKWYIVSFGMIGASLSGVSFISVPGMVGFSNMSYMQLVLGFPFGYFIIAYFLLPIYYRLNLISIYAYLDKRIGSSAYKTGAIFFFLSKIIGAAARLYLVTLILQTAIFNQLGISYPITVTGTILIIWLYTFRSGISTIIWTDMLQTFFMLSAMIAIIWTLSRIMNLGINETVELIKSDSRSSIFVWNDWHSKNHFIKQFFSGIFIVLVMTGLDQDMMQKNLSCSTLKESQKNMCWYGISFIFVNLLLLSLGVLLLKFAEANQIAVPVIGDEILPYFCVNAHLGIPVLICFTIGIVAAAFSSADSALTALTTSMCVDIINTESMPEQKAKKIRMWTHWSVSILFILIICLFRIANDKSVIDAIYRIATFTYGPLLGLFAFGLFTKRCTNDKYVPLIAVASPIITFGVQWVVENQSLYRFGYELLILNGAFTFVGLWLNNNKE